MEAKRFKKPTQHSAFIISLEHERYEPKKEGPGENRVTHKYPLIVLTRVKDVITLLGRYTDFLKFCNEDLLEAKRCLKNACFLVEISDYDLLQEEIICDHPPGYPGADHYTKYYNNHYLHIHRKPHGLYKGHLYTDYIE